jgi:hypothetical protein
LDLGSLIDGFYVLIMKLSEIQIQYPLTEIMLYSCKHHRRHSTSRIRGRVGPNLWRTISPAECSARTAGSLLGSHHHSRSRYMFRGCILSLARSRGLSIHNGVHARGVERAENGQTYPNNSLLSTMRTWTCAKVRTKLITSSCTDASNAFAQSCRPSFAFSDPHC